MTALLRAAHPGPTAAVTLFTTTAAVALGASAWTVLAILTATLSGQLAIGWSNDLIDADRDTRDARADKPVATGAVPLGHLRLAWRVALAVCIVVSLALGPLAAVAHLVGVGCGLAHNAFTKGSVWSWAPYALAFGLLPTFVTAAVVGGWAPWWASVSGALLGVAAHLANAAPDLDADARHGLLSLPQRWGAAASLRVAIVLLLVASLVSAWGPVLDAATQPSATEVALRSACVMVVAGICAGVLVNVRRGGPLRQAFPAVVVVAGINVVLLIVGIARVE